MRPAPGRRRALRAPAARSLDSYATRLRQERAARVAAAKRRGRADVPPAAPPATAPARKPAFTGRDGFAAEGQLEDHL